MNLRLAFLMAWRSLWHHRMVALATVAGVAIGMAVVSSILVVDHNTARSERVHFEKKKAKKAVSVAGIERLNIVRVHRQGEDRALDLGIPSQRGEEGDRLDPDSIKRQPGEEDYQAMRLAVRVASLLAFSVGAIIVFYTMRFSVASRAREFALLLCLGNSRGNVVWSLAAEALMLGGIGTLLGMLVGIPAAAKLLSWGVTTTGRSFIHGFSVPGGELLLMAAVSMLVALSGVIAPARGVLHLSIRDVLQPRFLSDQITGESLRPGGLRWLLPPLLAAAWLIVRPFIQSWLSVVWFFVFESAVVVGLTVIFLLGASPLLRLIIRTFELIASRLLPLESLLAGRRMRLLSDRFVFSIIGVVLVFSLLSALHSITTSLKREIETWSAKALYPYVFVTRDSVFDEVDPRYYQHLEHFGVGLIRYSRLVEGLLPLRLVKAEDLNRLRRLQNKPDFGPGQVILSETLARRFELEVGNRLEVISRGKTHWFDVVEITDEYGYFPTKGQYINIKSHMLFSDGNELFAGNLESTLGEYAAAYNLRGLPLMLNPLQRRALYPYYFITHDSAREGAAQRSEIDRDFLIFDYILAMTVLLAALGVVNTLLIQVRAREREFSVFRVVGMTRWQTVRLLLMEGAITGLVSGLLVTVLGSVLGRISVGFLDRFTLFELHYELVPWHQGLIFAGVLLVCLAAAVYPARVAAATSSAESLHYE